MSLLYVSALLFVVGLTILIAWVDTAKICDGNIKELERIIKDNKDCKNEEKNLNYDQRQIRKLQRMIIDDMYR
jgi:hypothetical protein